LPLLFLLFAHSVEYNWYLTTNGYFLKVKLPKKVCKELNSKTIILYLLSDGRVYRKSLKKLPKTCEVWKVIKNPTSLRILMFYPQTLKVVDVKKVEAPKF